MLELHYPTVTKTILERQYPGKPTLKVAFGNGNGAIFGNSSKLRASLFVTSRWPRSSGQTNYQVHHPPPPPLDRVERLQFRYTFYRPQAKRLRARKIGLQYKILIKYLKYLLLGTSCLGRPSGDVPCASEGVRTKHGPGVHGPPLWTGYMDHFHGPGPWTPCHGPGPCTVFFLFL